MPKVASHRCPVLGLQNCSLPARALLTSRVSRVKSKALHMPQSHAADTCGTSESGEASPVVGAAELAGCEAGWADGANWAGPHFRAPELRSASAGSEGVPFVAGMLLLDAAADGATPTSAPSSPLLCVPAPQILVKRTHPACSLCSRIAPALAGLLQHDRDGLYCGSGSSADTEGHACEEGSLCEGEAWVVVCVGGAALSYAVKRSEALCSVTCTPVQPSSYGHPSACLHC